MHIRIAIAVTPLGVALVEQSFESLRFAFDDLGVAQADSDLLMRQAVDVLAGHVRRHAAHFSSDPAVAKTRLPVAFAIWIAVTPMPEVPPCTSSDSPGASRPRS